MNFHPSKYRFLVPYDNKCNKCGAIDGRNYRVVEVQRNGSVSSLTPVDVDGRFYSVSVKLRQSFLSDSVPKLVINYHL